MNIGSSPSQASHSFTGSIDMPRTAFQMQQTLTGPDGEATRTIMVDAVEVNIHIDGESSIFRRVSLARLSKTTPTRPDNPRPPIMP